MLLQLHPSKHEAVGLMSCQHCSRWTVIKPTLDQCRLFCGTTE